MNNPSREEWKRLYGAAVAFRELGCWEWMEDTDLFAVQNPETGETGYCVVMGALGEFYALGVYRGGEGLAILDEMHADVEFEDPLVSLGKQNCLMASFGARNDLDKQDLALIRELGLRFRGANAWPAFRSHLPGYYPWFLDGCEARFLAFVLEQAVDVTTRYKSDPTLLDLPDDGVVFTRVPVANGADLAWKDEWRPPEPPPDPESFPAPVIDLPRLQAVKRRDVRRTGEWEIEMASFPEPVKEEGRPYYPLLLLCADSKSGYVLSSQLVHPAQMPGIIPDLILNVLEKSPVRPRKVVFRQPYFLPCLESLAPSLDFEIERADELPMAEEALDFLMRSF